MTNLLNGSQSGNFGWLSWDGSSSPQSLVNSLTPPGDSSTYVNPDAPTDHQVSVGDWVQARACTGNSKSVRGALDNLKTVDITVPVWDRVRGNNQQTAYRVSGFANIRLISYQLSGQDQITVRFLGKAICGGQNLPPVVNAGPDVTNSVHTFPAVVSLNGSVTDDGLPTGGTLTSTWSVVHGPAPVTFGNIHSPATTATFSQPGTYLLQLAASDSALSATDTVAVVMNLQDNPPQAFGQTVTINEDTTTNITLTGSDPDGDAISFQVVTLPQHGTLSGTPPQLTYTPNLHYNGSDSFTFKANDGLLDSAIATVNLIINPVNYPPVANSQSLTNNEDIPLPISLTGSDVEGSPLTYTIVASPTNGTLSGTPPNVVYVPATNYFGPDAFSFKVNDGTNDSIPAIVGLTILPVDDAPLVSAGADQLLILPASSLVLTGAVVFDKFPEQVDTIDWTQVSGPSGVSFSDPSNAVTSVSFTQSGIYDFRLTANDSFLTGSDDVIVTVDAPPAVQAGPNQTNTLPQEVTLSGAVADDGIPSNGILTVAWSIVSGPGTVVFGNPNATNTAASFSESGIYVLRLTASDGVTSSTSDVSVLINRAPIVKAGSPQVVTNLQAILTGTVQDDGFPAGIPVVSTWSEVSGPGTATFSLVSTTNSAPTTTVTFGATGVYVLRLTADDSLAARSADVTISVDAAPIVTVSNVPVVNFPNTASLAAAATDDGIPSGATLTYQWSEVSGPGTVTFADASALSTTASFSTSGVFVVQFQASDSLLSSSTNVSIIVNQPPVAQNESITVVENSQTNILLQASDAENQPLTYSIVSQPAHGTLAAPSGGNQYLYTPGVDFYGSDSFTFKANDGYADSGTATVTVTVLPQNHAPSFTAGANQTALEDAGPQSVPGWASNISPGPANESAQTVHFLVSSDNPSLFSAGPAIAADGTLTYTTATNANGVATVTVRAQDDGGTANGGVDTSAPQSFTITITAVNDPPQLAFPGPQTVGDAMPLVFDTNRLISVSDVDAGQGALQLSLGVAHGTLTLSSTNGLQVISGANGSSNLVVAGTLTDLNASLSNLTYTSILHYAGDETLSLSVNDLGNTGIGGPLVDSETVAITVVLTNHPPVFVSTPVTNATALTLLSTQTLNVPTATYTYQAAATDPDNDPLIYSLVSGPTNMTVNATNGLVQWVPAPAFTGTVTVTIQVSDGRGGTALQTFPIFVPPPVINQPPVVNAGPNRAFAGITNVITLYGSIADDGVPTNAPLTVFWSKVFGPGTVTFGNPNAPVTTAGFSASGFYRLQLVGGDSLEYSTNTVDIRADMLCVAPPPANIVAWLPATFDARDAITGTTGITQNISYPSGEVGPGFGFNGSTSSVRLPAQPAYNVAAGATGFTVEFWINPNTFQNGSVLGWANGVRIERFTGSSAGDSLHCFVTGTNPGQYVDASKLWLGTSWTWTHVALTYDAATGQASVYTNGVLAGSGTVGLNPLSTAGDFYLGQVPGSAGSYGGILDEVSIYSRPLNPEEIFAIFAAGNSGKCPQDNNLAPLAFAGPDFFVRGTPGTATLQGEVSDDGLPVNSQVHAHWSLFNGPGTVSFADSNSLTTTAIFSTNGVYVLQLTADDGEAQSSDLVEARVEDFCSTENPQGLVAWWPANGMDQEALNGYNVIRANGANYVPGRVASAFNFDGVNDYVQMPAQTNYNVAQSPAGFTMEFWINVNAFQNSSVLGWANGVRADRVTATSTGDTLRFYVTGTGAGQYVSSQPIWPSASQLHLWYHIALTYDHVTGVACIYVNGFLNATANVGVNAMSTAGDFYLENVPGSTGFFSGQLDEISLYSRPLSRLEVLSLYNSGSVGKCLQDSDQPPTVYAGPDISLASVNDVANLNGVVFDDGLPLGSTVSAHWQSQYNPGLVAFANPNSPVTTAIFSTNGIYTLQLVADDGEKQASDFVEVRVGMPCPVGDISGLAAMWPGNGNAFDKIANVSGVPVGTDYTNGEVGAAFEFHGTNDFILIPARTNYDIGQSSAGFTLEFWEKADFSSANRGVLSWNNSAAGGSANGVYLYQSGWTAICNVVDTNGGSHSFGIGSVFISAWHHFALTYDRAAGQAKVYLDGVLQVSQPVGNFRPQTSYDLEFGHTAGIPATFAGDLDEVTLYTRPLAQSEIQAIFNAGAAGKCITPGNTPPIVHAGPDQVIAFPTNTVTLNGVAADDGLPSNNLAIAWTYLAGDSSVIFSSTNTPVTTVSFTNTGSYVFQLSASDGQYSTNAAVTVTVLPASP